MAAELHMIQLELDVRALMRVAHDRRWSRDARSRRRWDDLGYLVHHQLAALFQDLAPQPFRAANEPRGPWLQVLGYSPADAGELRRRADELALPADRDACRLDGLRGKPMPASLFATGRRFGFEVRTCPVVRLSSEVSTIWCGKPQTFRKGAELDAFLRDRYLRKQDAGREDVYLGWLRERLAGAELVDGRLHAFRRVRLLRRGRRDGEGERQVRVPERPDALLTGTLEVTAPAAFAELLARGVGRHRAFGFGMLLLRPPGSG
jgi:CRISPR system Cascade subunit CasE